MTRGVLFGVKTMDMLLKNRVYIGEYRYGGVTVEGGIPQIVDEELFDRAQRRLAENKRNGTRRKVSVQAQYAPRYWLTDKLYCGECGGSMQGVSGTSKRWGCAQVVDGLFMRLLSRPLGVVRIRWGICRRGWCGCGGGCRSLRSRWRPRCRPGRGW